MDNQQLNELQVARQERLEELTIVGVSEELSTKGFGHLWDELYERMDEIEFIANRNIGFGLICNMRYMAGIQVSSTEKIPEGMDSITVPANEYAVFVHKGQIQFLKQTWDLIAQKYSIHCNMSEPSFERYDERFNPISDDSILEIYVPLKK
ncbi:GyrI-like domain-containing protein [Paenibacillus marinisediminis]